MVNIALTTSTDRPAIITQWSGRTLSACQHVDFGLYGALLKVTNLRMVVIDWQHLADSNVYPNLMISVLCR